MDWLNNPQIRDFFQLLILTGTALSVLFAIVFMRLAGLQAKQAENTTALINANIATEADSRKKDDGFIQAINSLTELARNLPGATATDVLRASSDYQARVMAYHQGHQAKLDTMLHDLAPVPDRLNAIDTNLKATSIALLQKQEEKARELKGVVELAQSEVKETVEAQRTALSNEIREIAEAVKALPETQAKHFESVLTKLSEQEAAAKSRYEAEVATANALRLEIVSMITGLKILADPANEKNAA